VIKELIQLPEDEKLYAIAYLSDDTVLHIRERYHKNRLIKYSYHHVSNTGINRWDNVPHHPSVATFPYHHHVHENITDSPPMDIIKVFREIDIESKKGDTCRER
jgi:effector-binding domain-containing protein